MVGVNVYLYDGSALIVTTVYLWLIAISQEHLLNTLNIVSYHTGANCEFLSQYK